MASKVVKNEVTKVHGDEYVSCPALGIVTDPAVNRQLPRGTPTGTVDTGKVLASCVVADTQRSQRSWIRRVFHRTSVVVLLVLLAVVLLFDVIEARTSCSI